MKSGERSTQTGVPASLPPVKERSSDDPWLSHGKRSRPCQGVALIDRRVRYLSGVGKQQYQERDQSMGLHSDRDCHFLALKLNCVTPCWGKNEGGEKSPPPSTEHSLIPILVKSNIGIRVV